MARLTLACLALTLALAPLALALPTCSSPVVNVGNNGKMTFAVVGGKR